MSRQIFRGKIGLAGRGGYSFVGSTMAYTAGNGLTLSGNQFSLTTPVTVANGGTGLSSGTSGGVPYYSGSTTIASSAALGTNNLVLGGGAGAAPTTDANWTLSSHKLTSNTGALALNNADSAIGFLAAGATKGVRAYSDSAGSYVEGVDNTGVGSYQPLKVGGSQVNLTLANVSKAQLDSTSGWQASGTTTNDSAASGFIGEYISANLAAGSAVSLSAGTAANVTSVSLTAGDWDVGGNVLWAFSSPANLTYAIVAIGTTSASLPTAPNGGAYAGITSATQTFNNVNGLCCGPMRLSLSTTTTVYLITDVQFTAGTVTAYGFIGARRAR